MKLVSSSFIGNRLSISSCDTPSFNSCMRCHSRSALNCMCLCSASKCIVIILASASFSSKLTFHPSSSDCLSLNLVSFIIISLFSCDSSVKSDEKLFGDARCFFLRIGPSSAVRLILIVSTATCLLSTPLSLTSQSMISSGLMDDIVDGVVLVLSLITSTNS